MKICFASHNQNKVNEINQMAPASVTVYGLRDLKVEEEIPETGATMEENSRLKSRYVYDRFKVPVFADDSGLEVDVLGGKPGVFSARYAGLEKDDKKNNELLLKNLLGKTHRSAQFKSVITFIDQKGNEQQFEGVVKGEISSQPIGIIGFGYDPIFVPEGFDRTFAQMEPKEKNRFSHRAIAFQKFLKYLKTRT